MYDIILTFDKRLRHDNARVVDQYKELEAKFTELRESNERLLQTEKLASIGMLTAVIAHEVNNPLTVVKGYVERLEEYKGGNPTDAMFDKAIKKIGTATETIEGIVSGLKNYVRTDDSSNKPISVNNTIQGSIDLVAFLYKKEFVDIETQFCDVDPYVKGNIGKLQQVIMNLLSNAKDAMEGREEKKITVSTKSLTDAVQIEVSDTGCGIEKDSLSKIFDKFYTTKPVGQGTGLGLDIIKSIIEDMGGSIKVESEFKEGTTFILSFKKI
jgi:C4-dicarboxylate-specific signal transduction histidine kinase